MELQKRGKGRLGTWLITSPDQVRRACWPRSVPDYSCMRPSLSSSVQGLEGVETRLQRDRDAAVRKDGEQQHERITDQRDVTRCSRKESGGAGNQRFRTARGTGGGRETGNQGTLPHGNSREHGGT